MIGTLLLMLIGFAGPTGEVVATSGSATMTRSNVSTPILPRAELGPDDRVDTGPGGGVSLILSEGSSLDLGGETSATLTDRGISLARGETRLVVDGPPLVLGFSAGKATLKRGIYRAAISASGMRIGAEAGAGEIVTSSGQAVALNAGQELRISDQGMVAEPVAATNEGWTLQTQKLRLASAAESSRRAKDRLVGDANDEVARKFLPSGQQTPRTTESTLSEPPAMPNEEATPTPDTATPETPPPATGSETEDSATTSVTQPAATSAISLALGSSSAALGAGSSGAAFSDAQQDSLTNATIPYNGMQLPLAGNIHLITAQQSYTIGDVRLRSSDIYPALREYWSIGLGASPKTQVVTTFRTASDAIPQTLRIPRFDAYLIRFPQSNYGIQDPANPKIGDVTGISGLVGSPPTAPQVSGAKPLIDNRAVFNNRATFALGEFALQRSSNNKPQIDIRRSDQDRQIIKSPTGNDNLDKVTLNPDVRFITVHDAKFFPEIPNVSRPALDNPVSGKPTYASLSPIQRAGATTLLADKLSDYSKRTGRTRFVLGGQVVDITGYRPPSPLRDPLRKLGAAPAGMTDLRRHSGPAHTR